MILEKEKVGRGTGEKGEKKGGIRDGFISISQGNPREITQVAAGKKQRQAWDLLVMECTQARVQFSLSAKG